jgi:PEP-CTERM motif
LRLLFTGGSSNGNDLQFQLDNIQINGTVPEPATVAGGLLGVLGLCWFQRRRLIRSVRFRRT